MKNNRRKNLREQWHSRPELIAFVERRIREALLGPAPLRAIVAEWEPSAGNEALSNWAPGIVRDEVGHVLGLLSRETASVPAADNRIVVSAEPAGIVRLSFTLNRVPDVLSPALEFAIYADADGPSGSATLEAFETLQTGVWDGLTESASHDPYPRRGAGPVWIDPTGMVDWPARMPLPFAERFMRLPYHIMHRDQAGTVNLRVKLGRILTADVVRQLRGRLFLNHLLLANRTVERIEPDASDGTSDEPIVLQGPSPLLLELRDLHTRRQYFDHRYVSIETDPSRLVRLVRLANSSGARVEFLGQPLSRRRVRLAYWRALDWRELDVRPGETRLELDREACLRVRTTIHPRLSAAPMLAQTRRALLSLLTEPARPHYPSRAVIARTVRAALPALLRVWIHDAPNAQCFLGFAIELRALPAPDDYAYPTWDIGLVPKENAPRQELAQLFPALAQRIAHRLGGAFPVRVTWHESEKSHE